MLFVTYYTDDYEIPVRTLVDSCKNCGVNIEAVRIDRNKRSWRDIVRSKPYFIKEMLKKHKYDESRVVWIDADSRVRKYPVLFDTIEVDIATRLWNCNETVLEPIELIETPADLSKFEPMSGVMFFHNSKITRKFVDRWIENISSVGPEMRRPDQKMLAKTILEDENIRYAALPMSYCFWRRFYPRGIHPKCREATIQVTRWMCKDADYAFDMATEENKQRESGTWKHDDWMWE